MGKRKAKRSQRSFVVFVSLVSVLTLTSALLLALAPAPLAPDPFSSLLAVDSMPNLDAIFQTKVQPAVDHWHYIYIHQSKTSSGNATTLSRGSAGLSDHFLVGNGEGTVDGEIQVGQRWNFQQTPLPPDGASEIDPDCISINVVGDFDRTVPTHTQLQRLGQLVCTLQGHFHIPMDHVTLVVQPDVAAGIGRYFPTAGFREQLLP